MSKQLAKPSKPSDIDLMRRIRLGSTTRGTSTRSSLANLKTLQDDELRMWKSWKGASHDVIHASWSHDGSKYAVGTAALVDPHTSQYNRPNNLLLGNIVTNTLTELPDHHTIRPNSLSTESSGLDPRLFQTVPAVGWSQHNFGERLYTASYDRTVKIWDTQSPSGVRCLTSYPHKDRVTELAISTPSNGLFVSGTEYANDGLVVFRHEQDGRQISKAVLLFTKGLPKLPFTASSLRFGHAPCTQDYFVAGLARMDAEEDGQVPLQGHLAIWQLTPSVFEPMRVTPCSQNIFDIAWHPSDPFFATANAAPASERKKGSVRSMVRVYDPRQCMRIIEYDCPAADLNSVTFCPTNVDYITASATDGTSYVWDYRRPDRILHRLCHGDPIVELPHDRPRELADVGVRVALWGRETSRFYTGSSDGLLKEWDIRKATEDAFVRNVASLDAEVMAGAFSPDSTNLVLGDAAGGVHLLSKAPWDEWDIKYVNAEDPSSYADDPWTEGRRAAAELVQTQQIEIVPGWGAGKGKHYQGPWASWAGPEDRKEKPVKCKEKRKRVDETSKADVATTTHAIEGDTDEDRHEALRAARKKAKKIKKKRKHAEDVKEHPAVKAKARLPKPSISFIDLTISDEDQGPTTRKPKGRTQANRSRTEDIEDDPLEDDGWFPPHWQVDANITAEEV